MRRSLAAVLSFVVPGAFPLSAAAQVAAAPSLAAPLAPLAPLSAGPLLTPSAPLSLPALAGAAPSLGLAPLTALPQGTLRPAPSPLREGRLGRQARELHRALRSPGGAGSAHAAAARPFDGLRAEAPVIPGYPSSVYAPLTRAQKAAFQARYLDYLRRRDGLPDREARRFSIREAFFQDLERNPVRRQGPPAVDQAVFARNETRSQPEKGLDERTLWALAMAKSNRSERWGVEYGLEKVDPRTRTLDEPMSWIEVEEFYHTRILKDALEVLGLRMRLLNPHFMTRLIIRGMVHLPKSLANILILNAEVAAVTAFKLLTDKARELFADQPEPLARMEALLGQILIDEVGHVHFVRSKLGPVRLKLARAFLPIFIKGFLKDVPELELLFGKERLKREILKADVDGIAAAYPDRFDPSGERR